MSRRAASPVRAGPGRPSAARSASPPASSSQSAARIGARRRSGRTPLAGRRPARKEVRRRHSQTRSRGGSWSSSWQFLPLLLEAGHPVGRIIADFAPDAVEKLDVRGATGQDGKRVAHATQIELGHDRMVTLLDQEAPALWRLILTDESEFGARKVKPLDVVGGLAARVWEEHLRRALLDNGVGDRRGEGVARRLGAEHLPPFIFRIVFRPSLARARKASS